MGAVCCCPQLEAIDEWAAAVVSNSSPNSTSHPHAATATYYCCACFRCCLRWWIRVCMATCPTQHSTEGDDTFAPPLSASSTSLLSSHLSSSSSSSSPSPHPSSDASALSINSLRVLARSRGSAPDQAELRLAGDGSAWREKTGQSVLLGREGATEPLIADQAALNKIQAPITGLGIATSTAAAAAAAVGEEGGGDDGGGSGGATEMTRVVSSFSLSDDDCCPTCLDGYDSENPKITTACGHHFHLSCIFEWELRSNRCPVCNEEMEFSEFQ